jgi:predicted DNA-binding protein (MmcQ/YjbR family)
MSRDYSYIPDLCLSLPGAVEEYKASWDSVLYRVRGKIFVLEVEDKEGNPYLNVKSRETEMKPLYDRYDALMPAYHMNKRHWTSLRLDRDCPEEVVRRLIVRSYELVVAGLPRREREALARESAAESEDR